MTVTLDLESYQRLATAALRSWVRSPDPMDGPMWDLFCDLVGTDPERFRDQAQAFRTNRLRPLRPEQEE